MESFLREQLQEEPIVASSVMVHSLNPIRERRQEAIDILSKYLDNLIAHPEEAKYRKIRTSNKIFAEKVAPIKGCVEFLEAVGYTPLQEVYFDFWLLLVAAFELSKADWVFLKGPCPHCGLCLRIRKGQETRDTSGCPSFLIAMLACYSGVPGPTPF